jgi:hypothetical protein
MVVQPGLEPAGDAPTSTVPWRWISSDRSRTAFPQVRSMINKAVDLMYQHKNRLILVEGPEITVRPVAARLPTRGDAE